MQNKSKLNSIICLIFIALFSGQIIIGSASSSGQKRSADSDPTEHNRKDSKKSKTEGSSSLISSCADSKANHAAQKTDIDQDKIVAVKKIANQELIESLDITQLPKDLKIFIISFLKNSCNLMLKRDITKYLKKDYECTFMIAEDNLLVMSLNDKNLVSHQIPIAIFQKDIAIKSPGDTAIKFPLLKAANLDISIRIVNMIFSTSRQLLAFLIESSRRSKNTSGVFLRRYQIRIYDLNMHEINKIDSELPINCLKFSPDDKYLALSNEKNQLELYNSSKINNPVFVKKQEIRQKCADIFFFNNCVFIVSADLHTPNLYVIGYQLPTTINGSQKFSYQNMPLVTSSHLRLDNTVNDFKFSPNNKYAYTKERSLIVGIIPDLVNKIQVSYKHFDIVRQIKIKENFIAGELKYNLDFSEPIYEDIQNNSNYDHNNVLNTVSFSKNNKFFAFYKYLEKKHTISIFDLQLKKITQEIEHSDPILSLEFPNDTELVVRDSLGYTRYKIVE